MPLYTTCSPSFVLELTAEQLGCTKNWLQNSLSSTETRRSAFDSRSAILCVFVERAHMAVCTGLQCTVVRGESGGKCAGQGSLKGPTI